MSKQLLLMMWMMPLCATQHDRPELAQEVELQALKESAETLQRSYWMLEERCELSKKVSQKQMYALDALIKNGEYLGSGTYNVIDKQKELIRRNVLSAENLVALCTQELTITQDRIAELEKMLGKNVPVTVQQPQPFTGSAWDTPWFEVPTNQQ